jgi:para-nitrobenzyl esterase
MKIVEKKEDGMKERIVEIESGKLQGIFGYDPRITVFKGVPYAAPPVGELRWRAPQPVEKWEGVRLASEYGPMAMQQTPGADPDDFWTKELHPAGPEFQMSEDCLYLNVFTPAKKGDEHLPVLVYIHGGGLTGGYPYEIEFDWEHMARKGIIVVAIAYRLGVFGFLSHPLLQEEHPEDPLGCYGHLDQMAALQWVHRNIEAFGGDPEKVTIAGQSAGAGSVMTLLSADEGQDVFRAAIVQSGIFFNFKDAPNGRGNTTPEKALKNGEDFFNALGVKTLEEARAVDAQKMQDFLAESWKNGNGFSFSVPIDGKFVKESSENALKRDHWGDRSVIFGYNRGEADLFKRINGDKIPETLEDLKIAAESFGDRKEDFLKITNCVTDADVKALGDLPAYNTLEISASLAGAIRDRQGHCTYIYEFDVDIPGEDQPGSFHGAELCFAYDALARTWRPFTGKHYDMARMINSYWINFIKSGDPNGLTNFGESLPVWKKYTEKEPARILFTTEEAKTIPASTDPLTKIRMECNMSPVE